MLLGKLICKQQRIFQSSELPDATNDANDSEIHNANNNHNETQVCNATTEVNDPQNPVATDVNESQTDVAIDNVRELKPSEVAFHTDQQIVKEEQKVVPQLSHENAEDLPQQSDTSVVA